MAAEKAMERTIARTPEGVAAQIEYMKGSYAGSYNGVPANYADDVPVAFLDVILEGLAGLQGLQ